MDQVPWHDRCFAGHYQPRFRRISDSTICACPKCGTAQAELASWYGIPVLLLPLLVRWSATAGAAVPRSARFGRAGLSVLPLLGQRELERVAGTVGDKKLLIEADLQRARRSGAHPLAGATAFQDHPIHPGGRQAAASSIYRARTLAGSDGPPEFGERKRGNRASENSSWRASKRFPRTGWSLRRWDLTPRSSSSLTGWPSELRYRSLTTGRESSAYESLGELARRKPLPDYRYLPGPSDFLGQHPEAEDRGAYLQGSTPEASTPDGSGTRSQRPRATEKRRWSSSTPGTSGQRAPTSSPNLSLGPSVSRRHADRREPFPGRVLLERRPDRCRSSSDCRQRLYPHPKWRGISSRIHHKRP